MTLARRFCYLLLSWGQASLNDGGLGPVREVLVGGLVIIALIIPQVRGMLHLRLINKETPSCTLCINALSLNVNE